MQTRPRLHIAFGQSAAGSLKQALAKLGRDEQVICEADDLGYGPINPYSTALRAEFYGEVLGYRGYVDEVFQRELVDAFWKEATASKAEPVAWLSRRCVREYAGFLEYISRRDEPPLVVDVADIEFLGRDGLPQPSASTSLGCVSAEQMISHDLFGTAKPMSSSEFRDARTTWQKLKAENADVRVLDSTGLISAPLSHFDEMLISCATTEWKRCARVVGETIVRNNSGAFYQTGDLLLWSRLRTLIEDGVLDGREDKLTQDSWVRRPS
jgi:hypothetical protein